MAWTFREARNTSVEGHGAYVIAFLVVADLVIQRIAFQALLDDRAGVFTFVSTFVPVVLRGVVAFARTPDRAVTVWSREGPVSARPQLLPGRTAEPSTLLQ